MTTRFDVLSVPHTDSNFTRRLLIEHGFECRVFHTIPSRNFKNRIDPDAVEGFILPLRNPWDVAESWAKRGSYDWTWEEAWEGFESVLDMDIRKYVFIIDASDKEARLQVLSGFVGKELTTEWTKENHSKEEVVRLNMPSEDSIRKASDLYERIYEETRANSA